MAVFTSFYPGGVTPDKYKPALPDFDYMPFFEEVVDLSKATQNGAATATTIKFNLVNGLKLKLVGTDFKFDSKGNPTDGTITAFEVYLNDGTTKMQTLTGLNVDLEAFYDTKDLLDQYSLARYLMRGNDTLKGSSGEQTLIGYGGDDTFIGGTGDDFVLGGEGKDTYDGNGGFDTLSFDDAYYTPSAYRGINLDASTGKVTDQFGNAETFTQFEQFRGTQFADTFKGSSGDDEFMGLGGRDSINGGAGFDVALYHRDSRRGGTGSVTVDLETGKATDGFGKTDTLVSIEGARTGDAADKLYGNDANNILRSGAGNDLLAGGLGNDVLRGEDGKDIFLFDSKLSATTNVDEIQDFSVADDTIRLDNTIFTKLTGTGALSSGQFTKNTTGLATDAADRIIYESDTGELYYDSNGNASGGSVLFATIGTGLALTAADFFIV